MNIALCGNPNVGKTTIFNRLTGADEPVGNWHGVTVDAKSKRSREHTFTDLPGAYSLTARTDDERITSERVIFGDYDVYVYVAEANDLRRNLYMFMQLVECEKRCVLVVNMLDEARSPVDLELLSKRLGVPVVGTSNRYENPRAAIISAAESGTRAKLPSYTERAEISRVKAMAAARAKAAGLNPTFAAIKIIERDERMIEKVGIKSGELAAVCDRDTVSRLRYEYIDRILEGVTAKPSPDKKTLKIDKIILGKAALPIFFLVMACVFVVTFECGRPLSDLLIGLTEKAAIPVKKLSLPDWTISLLCDGIISGVGATLSFLPQVVLLFLLTTLLQDSGYMSRVAFVTDDFFKRFGLSGRAAFSVILGLGCSATAILSTRGIAGKTAKRRAAFVTPFCPCSARLAVFTSLSAYFGLSGFVVAAMYLLGFVAALAILKISAVIGKARDEAPLIMEMPPYRVPQIKRVLKVVTSNVLSFIWRVGSVVLTVSVIVWVLCNFSIAYGFGGGAEVSLMRTFAGFLAPLFKPLGFGSWRAVAALISGIAAKETVISVIASLGGANAVFGGDKLAAISFMIFTALYVPCVATLSVLAKENGIKSMLMSIVVHTVAAYLSSLIFYRSAVGFAQNKIVFFCVYGALALVVATAMTIAVFRRRVRKPKTA